ncbi:hypothetical protein D0437_27635 [Bacillus cereus]|uniref:Uncharacterized protein n=1 Tax=Bacillus cereus TaxID=1396 RepID=A0A9X7M324_BACCE|nr:hypothetical protein D0437_27635 [Bacillus cereus]
MEIKVNEQTQRFYLAVEEWEPVVGHEIKVGLYRFCTIPLREEMNISEVTSGAKMLCIPMSIELMWVTTTKEETVQFFEQLGEHLKRKIERAKDFEERFKNMQQTTWDRLGEMPPIENVDTDWRFEESERVH